MPVNIGEMVSSVTPEPEDSSGGGVEAEWQKLAGLRELYARMRRDLRRTAAEGFDD